MRKHRQVADYGCRSQLLWFDLTERGGQEFIPVLADDRRCDVRQAVAANPVDPPLQLLALVANPLRLEWGQNAIAVGFQHLLDGVALGNGVRHVATFAQLRFNALSPLFGNGLVVEGLRLRRKALQPNLDVVTFFAGGVDAFSNACHMFFPSRV